MRYGKFVCAVLVISIVGCRDAAVPSEIAAGPPEALCVETDSAEPDIVTLKSPACGGQCEGGGASYFSVEKDTPLSFALYGVAGIEYCVEMSRDYGYITISHERGTVTRDGDLFTWCITPANEDPKYMTVRSFTASAGFELTVP